MSAREQADVQPAPGDGVGVDYASLDPKERTRRRLIEAAYEAFAERGYHRTLVRDIVDRAGLAVGTFYLYFPSKKALFLELIDEALRHLRRSMGLAVRDEPNYARRVEKAIIAALNFFDRHQRFSAVFFRENMRHDPDFEHRIRAAYDEVANDIRYLLEKGMKAGHIRPANVDVLAYAIIGVVDRVAYHYVEREGAVPFSAIAKDVACFCLGGLTHDAGEEMHGR